MEELLNKKYTTLLPCLRKSLFTTRQKKNSTYRVRPPPQTIVLKRRSLLYKSRKSPTTYVILSWA